MQAGSDALPALANLWLARFEDALAARDPERLRALFADDAHWRDVLALTWRIRTFSGPQRIAKELTRLAAAKARALRTDPARTPPREVTRAGRRCIEAIFRFETAQGPGAGVVRFAGERDSSGDPRAWTLLTALEALDAAAMPRSAGDEPAVLVVGGGQAGLSIGAQLAQRGIAARIVDRWPRVGDCWRRRYHALKLHNQVHVNHLPGRRFPADFPTYIPKDLLADWFESYAEAMALDYWTGTEFKGGTYDEAGQRWSAIVERDGEPRELHPRHIVMATGASGIPNLPDIPALKAFRGKVIHASQYQEGSAWRGRKAVVIGTGTSGHDIAQDLHSSGAQVTLVQRSPTLVIECDPSAQLVYSLYSEGPPLEDCDLLTVSVPLAVSKKAHQLATAHAKQLDKPLLDALEAKGFRLSDGDEGTGWQFLYLTRGGGYYFNVGCSNLIVEGKIAFHPFSELDGCLEKADLVVLATGYQGQEATVRKLFGAQVAARVGPIWGFGEEQELRNMFTRTAQSGLWFIAGSFAQCRIYSKYLALQIQASEAGVLSARACL